MPHLPPTTPPSSIVHPGGLRASAEPRGYALVLVIMLVLLLGGALSSLTYRMSQAAATTGEVVKRKQTFYATDGMSRAIYDVADQYLRLNPNATQADVQAYFTPAVLDSITPTGYTRAAFNISLGAKADAPLPNGPFAGVSARQYPISLDIKLRHSASLAASAQRTSVVLGQVSAFQFFIFGEGYVDLFPWPAMTIGGRTHINGDFCVGGKVEFAMETITASGRVIHIADDNRCRRKFSNRVNLKVAVKGSCPDFPENAAEYIAGTGYTCTMQELEENEDNGCVSCGSGWESYAKSRWNGGLLDEAHGVNPLRLPLIGKPLVQAGYNAIIKSVSSDNLATETNLGKSRLLVDPLLPLEPVDVATQKIMYKADIRIINGVWFLRDPGAPLEPGIPIWSDHPGSYSYNPANDGIRSSGGAVGVGQADLKTARSWDNTYGTPRMYSYYSTDTSTGKLLSSASGSSANQAAVISYGTLHRDDSTTPPHWVPGFGALVDGSALDDPSKEAWCGCDGPGGASCTTDYDDYKVVDARSSHCSVGEDSGLLRGTEMGFTEGHHILGGYAGDRGTTPEEMHRQHRAYTLPMNFDVAAFQAALNNNNPGELGAVFSAAGRVFNGIVYITNTWPDALTGFSDTSDLHPPSWPSQGDQDDPDQTGRPASWPVPHEPYGASDYRRISQDALPQQLCSSSGSGGVAGDPFDAAGRFVIPDCANYGPSGVQAYVNAVRVFNGAKINPTAPFPYTGHVTVPAGMLPSGLSIVTNLPMFVLGEWNTDSDTSSATATPWTPTMVGGDVIFHLSNAWDDTNSHWWDSASTSTSDIKDVHEKTQRVSASLTKYNMAVLAGWTVTDPTGAVHGGGVHNFTRYIEQWAGNTHWVRGSFLVGFAAVYTRSTVDFGWSAFGAPIRDWAYDRHFDSIANQPPGAPVYNVNAVKSWRRQ